ncbi:hypothetical protein B0H14DRAFT_3502244 [Mycena olivaceomarginata]|nr:hypothetical protein B0H14DRAFT_3502244 [Mycena olivaceomarginata]
MAPPEWTTVAQKEYLQTQLPAFLSATEKKGTSLARFWGTLREGWFERWPTETTLGVPLPPATGEEDIRSDSQILAVGKATQITQKRLNTWMYNRRRAIRAAGSSLGLVVSTGGKRRSLFSQLKRKKSTRPYRKIEIYQRLYGAKLKEEAHRRGYGSLNEEAAAEGVAMAGARVMSEAEAVAAELAQNEATEARLKESRRQRMSLQRTVALEMFASETPEVLAEVDQETLARNEERTAIASEDLDERTPEDMQLAIDELGEVVKVVLESMAVATGWQFMLVGGGPSPRDGGKIQAKTICFGTTTHGTDFRGSHPNFDEAVLTPFIKYLKRVFPHEIRDARVLSADNDEEEGEDAPLAGLLTLDELPPCPQAPKPKRMRRTKPRPKSTAAIPAPRPLVVPLPIPLVVPTETEYRTSVRPPPQARPELIPVPDDFDETIRAINYHFENPAGPPPLDWSPPLPLDWDLNHDEDVPSLAYDGPSRRISTSFDFPASLGAASTIKSTISSVATYRPGSALSHAAAPVALTPAPAPAPPPAGAPVAPAPTPPPAPAPAGAPVAPVPAPVPAPASPPAGAPVAPAPTPLPAPAPAGAPVAPVPAPVSAPASPPAAGAPVAPAPAPAPTGAPVVSAPVAPVPAPPPAGAPVASAHVAPAPTLPPAPAIPHYPLSRPMANAPKGHPLAAPAAAQGITPAIKRKPGRPRKKPAEPAGEMAEGVVGGMTPEARAESDRIHREEAELQETRKEMLRRGKAVDERAAAALEKEQRSAALLHNPAGGAPLTIIKRSSRAIRATLDPEGNPLIHPVIRTRGDMGNGGRLALRVLGSDALRAQEDAEMLEKLSGKKAAGTKTSAAKKAVSNRGAKRKASDTIPVGETAAK